MAINLNDNIGISAPKAVDSRTGKFVSGAWIPFSSVNEANAAISQRYVGLTVLIDTGSGAREYWYKDGLLNSNLVEKIPLNGFYGNLFS